MAEKWSESRAGGDGVVAFFLFDDELLNNRWADGNVGGYLPKRNATVPKGRLNGFWGRLANAVLGCFDAVKTRTMQLAMHHIGILVRDIAESARIYEERFGCRPVGPTVHDPVQTAYVQFLDGVAMGVPIELISPDGPESKLAGATKKGGGLNHLAYAVDAIEDDCRRLRSAGMLLLQSPVAANAFPGRRIAWLMGRDGIPIELVERGADARPRLGDELRVPNSHQE